MALFGIKKNKEAAVEKAPARKEKKAPAVPALAGTPSHVVHRGRHHDIIIRPRITEKSGLMSESAGVYTFEVLRNATKPMIASSVKALYKVTPVKVRIVNLPAKRVFVRGKRGTTSRIKKAMVYLKKGDKIDFV